MTSEQSEDAYKMINIYMVSQFFGTDDGRTTAISGWLFSLVEKKEEFKNFQRGAYIFSFTLYFLKGVLNRRLTQLRGQSKKEDKNRKVQKNKNTDLEEEEEEEDKKKKRPRKGRRSQQKNKKNNKTRKKKTKKGKKKLVEKQEEEKEDKKKKTKKGKKKSIEEEVKGKGKSKGKDKDKGKHLQAEVEKTKKSKYYTYNLTGFPLVLQVSFRKIKHVIKLCFSVSRFILFWIEKH